jgi:hypothetical protein
MLVVAEQYLQNIIEKYGKHPVSSDGGVHGTYQHGNF